MNEDELNKLNDLTNIFLVFAEDEAKERHVMTMQDWINATDDLLKFRRKKVLDNATAEKTDVNSALKSLNTAKANGSLDVE